MNSRWVLSAALLFYFIKGHTQPETNSLSISSYLDFHRMATRSANEKDWDAAAQAWKRLSEMNPTDGESWYHLGECQFNGGHFTEATAAFRNALRIGAPPRFESAYFIAKCFARSNSRKDAIDWLQFSFDLGYRFIMAVPHDSTFLNYWQDPWFKKITGGPAGEFLSRDEGWRSDLALMVREVKRRAPQPYRMNSEHRFDSAVADLTSRIPTLSDIQLIIEFEKILVMVGDGHTMIYAFYERPEFQMNLPVEFYMFKEGLFITEADQRYQDLLGSEILAFDNHSVDEIVRGIDPIINRDNELGPKVMGLMRMRTVPLLFGLGLVNRPDAVTLTIRTSSGIIQKVNMKADCPIATRRLWDGLPPNWLTYLQAHHVQPPLYLRDKFTHYWFTYLQSEHTIYFQYNEMANDQNNPFEHYCDSLFAFIEANPVNKLIIDMRWNHGGNSLLAPYLLKKILGCRKFDKPGCLFGIIGRRTYSATINLLGYLERFTPIIFMGEPTGSSPNFIGEDNPFELPYSKLMANISDLSWQTSWPLDQREWFQPMILTDPSMKDYIAGNDPVLDMILAYHPEK